MARAPKKPGVWLPTEGEKVWVEATVTRTAAADDGTLDQVTVEMPNGNKFTFPWGDWIKPAEG